MRLEKRIPDNGINIFCPKASYKNTTVQFSKKESQSSDSVKLQNN
ncbi:unknown [Coraliomargarita sp. CAG:312]|nr:unknown [Coraliomargarita sp. CAG:312]